VSRQEDKGASEIFKNMFGYMSYAVDEASADKLWTLTEDLLRKAKQNK